MSEQRTVDTTGGVTRNITIEDQRNAALEAQKLRADKKARFARVLERGYIVDRLSVEIPPGLHGEWVAVDQVERWEALGFEVDKKYAFKRQLHPDGSGDKSGGAARVGDVIFMTCPQEDYEIMQELKQELFQRTHGSPKDKKRLMQKEEQEFRNVVEMQMGMPVIDEGKESPARKEQIKDAIAAAEKRVGEQAPAGLAEIGTRK